MVPPIMRLAAKSPSRPRTAISAAPHPVADPVAGVAPDQDDAVLHAGSIAGQGGAEEVAGIGRDVDGPAAHAGAAA